MEKNSWDSIITNLLDYWPEHRPFIKKVRERFSQYHIVHDLADIILTLTDNNVHSIIKSYKWMCEMLLEEELHFRRHDAYRFSSFAEVNSLVYQNDDLMHRYMDGLLLSQILWSNHIEVFDFYINEFLASTAHAMNHLEVGPGHGLFLHYAAQQPRDTIQGWDISPSSLEKTNAYLKKLGSQHKVKLRCQDITLASSHYLNDQFDSLVISEVLEHVENPIKILTSLCEFATTNAKMFINVPVNSPSIDHIYHFKTPEEVTDLVESVGLHVEDVHLAPASCLSEASARKIKSTISCAIIATI